jgi:hypothetical protein
VCERISNHLLEPDVRIVTTFAGDMYAGGVAFTTGSTAGRGRERKESDAAASFAGMTSDTVVVRAVTAAATPHPERTSTAAAVPRAARVGIIEGASVNVVD